MLLFCCKRNHDVVQRTQTFVDVQSLHSPDAFSATFRYVFRARKVNNVPAQAILKATDREKQYKKRVQISAQLPHILLLFEAPENLFLLLTDMEMMRCERLECAFMLVAPGEMGLKEES